MEINRECAYYCIAVIRAVMQERLIPAMPETLSLAELYGFARLHGVEAMVYHGLCQLDMDSQDPVWMDWENRAAMLMTQSIVQLTERDMLLSALPEAGIELLPVKGCWLKEQYPEIDYRQMSDLDLLIHEEDAISARGVMQRLGYSFVEESGEHHDSYAKPPYMGVELHLSLLPEEDDNFHYYNDIWSQAVSVEECPGVFRLKAEDEYIFYMVHLYKHMLYAGAGIRSFLDCVVYWQTYPDMDGTYLSGEFEKLGLTKFVSAVQQLAFCWFVSGDKVPESAANLENNVIHGAAHGTEEQWFQRNMDKLYKKYKSRFVAQMAYWFSRVFAPLEEMEPQYPVLKRYPFLLPVFWVVHLIQKITREPEDLLQHFRRVRKTGDNYGEH